MSDYSNTWLSFSGVDIEKMIQMLEAIKQVHPDAKLSTVFKGFKSQIRIDWKIERSV